MQSFRAAVRFLDGTTGVFTVDDVPDYQSARYALLGELDLVSCLIDLTPAAPPPLLLEIGPREVA